jgi:hypothetical protein
LLTEKISDVEIQENMGTILKITFPVIIVIILFITIRSEIKSNKKRKSLDSSFVEREKSNINDISGPQNETIISNGKKSFLTTTPSGCLALLTLFVTTIVLFVIGEAFIEGRENRGAVTIIAIIIYYLVISVCCFFIVKQNPGSIWYVPLICNALLILSAIVESNFWKGTDWIFVCSGWALSVIVSIIGALIGKKHAITGNP